LAGIAFTLPTPFYLQATLAFFWIMAFSSATHDIAADGFYMLALDDSQQSFFVGIRSTFYSLASITGQGFLIILAGFLERTTSNIPYSWSLTFFIMAGLFLAFFVYHRFLLPYPKSDTGKAVFTPTEVMKEFVNTFKSFFTKKGIGLALTFILVYRLAEAMLVKLAYPFLLDPREIGGLGLRTEDAGLAYGTFGVVALTLGGIIGGILASRKGLKYWIWPMALAITLPNAAYLLMAIYQPESFIWIYIAVATEQFGYGFGFTAYMLFMIYFSQGEHKTAHYSICTGFMALGMMIPGMAAGWIQEQLGYLNFFIFIMITTIPTLLIIPFIKIDKDFGKAKKDKIAIVDEEEIEAQ
ncbi:MAG: AmpG family muropeptide MFS transporter, partial [Bacteroidales bacterium]|nr:AmpG family muropeptide MFS transporter [Bacteroidales bacterium]